MKRFYEFVWRYPRTSIVIVTVAIRAFFAYVFYGSIDVSAFIGIHGHTVNQTLMLHPVAIWCSFPVLPFYLWLSGLLSCVTGLPIAFCFKLLPIFFDATLAVLLYDMMQKIRSAHAFSVALLYALCPVSLIITCIHGQWDAMPVFCLMLALYVRTGFNATCLTQMIYGALFAFSFLLKPLSVILVPFFFMPIRDFTTKLKSYISSQIFIVLGLVSMVLLCFACFTLYGLSVVSIIDKVLRYLNKGQATFGFPLAYPFNMGILSVLLKNRLWMMSLIGGIAWLYHNKKLDVYTSMLLSLLCVYSFGMLSPQYFAWAVPFFLIAGYYRLFASYTFLITIFCIFYYMNPMANSVVPYQSMLSFTALRGWEWFMPPAWFTSEQLIPVVKLLGNYVIPFFCMGSVVYILAFGRHDVREPRLSEKSLVGLLPYLSILLGLTLLIAILMFIFDTASLAPLFNDIVAHRFDCYAIRMVDGHLSGAYANSTMFNGASFLVALLLGWCWYAGITLYRKKQ